MKINLNKKDNMKIICVIIILLSIIVSVFFIHKYCFGTWIFYGENIPPKGTTTWNTGLSYRIKVTRTGKINGYYNKEKIDKSELEELKKLVKEIESSEISDIYSYDKNGLFIDGKSYKINEKNRDAYYRILEIIK